MTEEPLVIAIDSSTSSTKAIVVDPAGNVVGEGKSSIPLLTPGMDRYEHDPRDWWKSTDQAIRSALSMLRNSECQRIAALGITHQRETFCCLDENGKALRPAILWLDSRSGNEITEYGSEYIHQLSGKPADTTPALYKMIWMSRHEPDIWTSAQHIVDVHAYLSYALTGKWVSGTGSADTLGLFDISARNYASELCELANLRREQLPELIDSGDIIGTLLPEIAREWGIAEIPVIAGVGDGQAAGLGANSLDVDVAYANIGTSIVAGVHDDSYTYRRAYRTLISGLPGHYIDEVVLNSGSILANWFRDNLGDPQLVGQLDPQLEKEAGEIAPGSQGLVSLTYWNAAQSPYWDPYAKGAIVGFGSGHTRAHMYRSLLEGMAMELRRNLNGIESGTGTALREIHIVGGGSHSDVWRHIIADVTGLPLVTSRTQEISALGAAMMAMTAIGRYPTVREAAQEMSALEETTYPDSDRHHIYSQWQPIHDELYSSLKKTFLSIHQLRESRALSAQFE